VPSGARGKDLFPRAQGQFQQGLCINLVRQRKKEKDGSVLGPEGAVPQQLGGFLTPHAEIAGRQKGKTLFYFGPQNLLEERGPVRDRGVRQSG
jgi:hypothetical protein